MNPDLEKTTEYVRRNDIVAKLHAAIERVDIGKMWTPFIGLEDGRCTLDVVYDGVNVSFQPEYHGVPGFEPVVEVSGEVLEPIDVDKISEPTIVADAETAEAGAPEAEATEDVPDSGEPESKEDVAEVKGEAEDPEPGKPEEKGSRKKKRS